MQARQAKETQVLALGVEAPGNSMHRMAKYPKDIQKINGVPTHSTGAGYHSGAFVKPPFFPASTLGH